MKKLLICSVKFILIIMLNKKIVDAIACVMKYLNPDSEGNWFKLSFIKGIIDNRLISRPIHILIQEYDEITINDLVIIVIKKINL